MRVVRKGPRVLAGKLILVGGSQQARRPALIPVGKGGLTFIDRAVGALVVEALRKGRVRIDEVDVRQ